MVVGTSKLQKLAFFGPPFVSGCGAVIWGAAQGGYEWPPYFVHGAIIIGLIIAVVFGSSFTITFVGWLAEEMGEDRFGRAVALASKLYNWKEFQIATFGILTLMAVAIGCSIIFDPKFRSESADSDGALTLAKVFQSDFSQADCGAIRDERIAFPTGEIETIRVRVCKKEQPHLTYKGHVFAAIYVPASHHTEMIIQHISRNLRDLLHGAPRRTLLYTPPRELDRLRESGALNQYWMFMGPVFLYCETPLFSANELLEGLSRSGNVPFEIRSTEYLEREKLRRNGS